MKRFASFMLSVFLGAAAIFAQQIYNPGCRSLVIDEESHKDKLEQNSRRAPDLPRDGRGGPFGTVSRRASKSNAALAAYLAPLLPAGSEMSCATTGFRSANEFASALHISHNLGIPFEDLKARMTRGHHESLGKAIQMLRPDLNRNAVKSNIRFAERQVDRDFRVIDSLGIKDRIAASIERTPKLGKLVPPMLPSGMTLTKATTGFKSLGDFLAALYASDRLGLSFVEIQDRVTAGESLGTTIYTLRPDMDAEESMQSAAAAYVAAKRDEAAMAASSSTAVETR